MARRMLIMSILLLIAGCAEPSYRQDPDKILRLAVSALAGQDYYAFTVKSEDFVPGQQPRHLQYEGYIQEHNRLYIRKIQASSSESSPNEADRAVSAIWFAKKAGQWAPDHEGDLSAAFGSEPLNPLPEIERLHLKPRLVKWNTDASTRKLAAIDVLLERREAERMIRQRLQQEIDRAKRHPQIRQLERQLDAKQRSRFRRELDDLFTSSNAELEQLLLGKSAEAAYTMWVDRKTWLPVRIVRTVRLCCAGDQAEEQVMDISFHSYNRPRDLSQLERNMLE
jgi:hypothetical protein